VEAQPPAEVALLSGEEQPDEEQTRLVGDDPAVVHRLLAVLPEDRQVDPREVGAEPGAPDHIGHVEDAFVLQKREPVSNPYHPRDASRLDHDRVVGAECYCDGNDTPAGTMEALSVTPEGGGSALAAGSHVRTGTP
jgi:hypothetical protein